MLVLECTHKVISDDPVVMGDWENCPSCGTNFPIVDFYIFRDEDI